MENVSQQGRTVIFVSHNMNALQRLCPQSILLNHGRLVIQDNTSKVIEQYLTDVSSKSSGPRQSIDLSKQRREGTGKVKFESVSYSGDLPSLNYHPYTNGPLEINLNLVAKSVCSVGSVAVVVFDRYGTKLVNADTLSLGKSIDLRQGLNLLKLRMNQLHLNPGVYIIGLWVADPPSEIHDYIPSAALFEVVETEAENIRVRADGLVPVEFSLEEAG